METIEMGRDGRLVIPAPMRRQLGFGSGPAYFLADIVDGKIVLTAADVVPRAEQEWLESDAVTALIDQADRNIQAGNVHRITRARMREIRESRASGVTP
jgi:bifunctional DNA-binding transcriptional regulator/antitoxin component of YhaV-PrlF toxin-antitoxin module